MRFNRKFLSALLAVCMILGLAQGAFASEIHAEYGSADYSDIAASTYARMLLYKQGNGVVAAANENGLYGLVDLAGNVIADFKYPGMWVLDGGLFKFSNSTDPNWNKTDTSIKQGVIDSNGNVLLPMGPYKINCRMKTVMVYNYESRQTQYYTLDWTPSTSSAYWSENTALAQSLSASVVSYTSNEADLDTISLVDEPLPNEADLDAVSPEDEQLPIEDVGTNSPNPEISLFADDSWKSEYTTVRKLSNYDQFDLYYVEANSVGGGWEWGVVDLNGTVIVPLNNGDCRYSGPNPDGYYVVNSKMSNVESSSSYVFKNGVKISTSTGENIAVSEYRRNLVFESADKPGYKGLRDIDGRILLAANFTNIQDVPDEPYWYTVTNTGGLTLYYGLYGENGEPILNDVYTVIRKIANERYMVRRDGKYGVMSIVGTTATEVIPLEYDDYELYGYRFNIFTKGGADTAYTLDGETIMESTGKIDVFASKLFGGSSSVENGYWDLHRSRNYEGHNGNVLPFIIRTSGTESGYATYYVDVQTGDSQGYIPYRASNINEDGYFVYQDANGKYGIGGTNGLPERGDPLTYGVKYVPYSSRITIEGMEAATYQLASGSLPAGLVLYPDGEIYGVPLYSGFYTFKLRATLGDDPYNNEERVFTLRIVENTDANVLALAEQGYDLLTSIGENKGNGHYVLNGYTQQTFSSAGLYEEFSDLWLDGRKLTKDVDYSVDRGSTIISIPAATLQKAGSGTHTIAAEFRRWDTVSNGLLSGFTAQNFTVESDNRNTIPNAVKYVPYSCFLGETVSFGFPRSRLQYLVSSGVLPQSLTLNTETGEISGIPMISGTFSFSLKIETDYGEIAEYPMSLFIEDNTNSAVQRPNDYPIIEPVGIPDPHDPNHFYKFDYNTEVLRIDGPFYQFWELYIDGIRKIRNVDYEVREGSTVITIYGETFAAVGPGTHTIAAEFREGGRADGTLKTVAQNYTIPMSSNQGNNNYVPSTKPANKPSTPAPVDPAPEEPHSSGFPFVDVLPPDWFYDDVKWAYESKMMTGVSETRFAPTEDISQATIVTVLARLANVDLSAFSDASDPTIEKGKWYSEAAVWAKQAGLLPDNSSFTGEEKIPREQMAIMLVKYLQSLGISAPQSGATVEFPDADQMSRAGNAAFQTLYHAGIFKGVGGNRMDPGVVTSRSQFAALVHRVSVFVQTQ